MSNILQIGFTTEGTTDVRFLENVIRRSFEFIVLDCNSQIEVYPPEYLRKKGENFVEQVVNIVKKYPYFHVICIHSDADSPDIEDRLKNNFEPVFAAVEEFGNDVCKNLVTIIPVQMTEAWMLADLDLLKEKIGTSKSNRDLGLPNRIKSVENLADPKAVIKEALRVAQLDQPRRRKKLKISQLYSPLSQELSIEKLMQLPSFRYFMENIRSSLKKLKYL